ncbi:histone chaperone ASF1A [Corapipo altera]|uniref:histone chaperone ASF1A n=1 Tax=Corapipo altera TaxID=415028 RepID=UPI000FD68D3A|nr:histone chaperone ASF1A [Corapipo altera]
MGELHNAAPRPAAGRAPRGRASPRGREFRTARGEGGSTGRSCPPAGRASGGRYPGRRKRPLGWGCLCRQESSLIVLDEYPAVLSTANTTCLKDLEWKIIYVGSAESEEYDQVLDSVLVGPVPAGRHMFVFQADAPNPGLIPDADAVGVTVVLITCTYRGQEFIRVGYYVNNEYTETELRENPPVKPDFSKLQRNILASNPRVTRFHINWEDNTEKLEDAESSNPNLQSLLSTDALPSASKGWSTSENSLNVMLESHMDCM